MKTPEQNCAPNCECNLLEEQLNQKDEQIQVLVEAFKVIKKEAHLKYDGPNEVYITDTVGFAKRIEDYTELILSSYQAQAEARVKARYEKINSLKQALATLLENSFDNSGYETETCVYTNDLEALKKAVEALGDEQVMHHYQDSAAKNSKLGQLLAQEETE